MGNDGKVTGKVIDKIRQGKIKVPGNNFVKNINSKMDSRELAQRMNNIWN